MRWWVAGLVACASCGRYSFARHDQPDASDVLVWPTGPFSTPQLVTGVSDPLTDDDPTATGDALELYFTSERGGAPTGFADIYVSTRASIADPWGAPTPVVELNSTDEDQAPGISSDGLTIYFSSRRPGGPGGAMNSNIWVATRPDRQTPWSTPAVEPNLSSAADEFEPQPNLTETYLGMYRALSATDKDIVLSTRASAAVPWSAAFPQPELNMTGAERSPFMSPDGLTIWFSSDRLSGTNGVNDIFIATRASTADPFGTPAPLPELDGPMDDDDPWISTDGHILLMTSNRTGNYEIYEARR